MRNVFIRIRDVLTEIEHKSQYMKKTIILFKNEQGWCYNKQKLIRSTCLL